MQSSKKERKKTAAEKTTTITWNKVYNKQNLT